MPTDPTAINALVARAREMSEAATAGPWEYHRMSSSAGATQAGVRIPWNMKMWWNNNGVVSEMHCDSLTCWTSREWPYVSVDGDDIETPDELDPKWAKEAEQQFANLQFVAESRTLIPALCDAIEALQGEVAK